MLKKYQEEKVAQRRPEEESTDFALLKRKRRAKSFGRGEHSTEALRDRQAP
jgi:hypothetical protein